MSQPADVFFRVQKLDLVLVRTIVLQNVIISLTCHRCMLDVLINILLWIIGWIPGVLHAW
jgi:uncharacterized membrane protein YqaE (UPF0057 family)